MIGATISHYCILEELGECAEATQMLPVEKDALWGRAMVENLALVYTTAGEQEKAIDKLEYLLSIPGVVSSQFLKGDPAWNSLRSNARFQKLLSDRN